LPEPKERSVSLYQRNKEDKEASVFEDFKIIKLIGRGTFGKVYLVKHEKNQQLHAMKSIRKDIVLEHDSLESLKVEKLILL
jgi:protein-serine/threonine kinase